MENIEFNNLEKLKSISSGTTRTEVNRETAPADRADMSQVVAKLDNIYKGLVGGEICVYLDGTEVSRAMSGLA